MSTYAIGDIQGCADELEALLDSFRFDAKHDRLWFVGDLVNRGPKSLEVLRRVRALGDRAVVVLGNHDLHLVCLFEGFAKRRADDTLDAILEARDARELVDWLRKRPLMHVEAGYAMVHAGLLPQWTVARAAALAREVETQLRGHDYRKFLDHLYGSRPDTWDEGLRGWDRLRVIVNAMTRLRFCTADGVMEFHAKGDVPPKGFAPWFEARRASDPEVFVCGHWSTLGLKLAERLVAIDTGCVWGGSLSALRLEDRALFQVPCTSRQKPAD